METENCTDSALSNNSTQCVGYSKHFIIINFAISALIIIINQLVFYLFLVKKKTLLLHASNWLLASLSVCDLLKGIGIILILVALMDPRYREPATTSAYRYRIFVDVYNTLIIKAIALHLCGVTMDRFVALFYPYKYVTVVTIQNTLRYILVCWVIPLITSTLQLSWVYDVIQGHHGGKDLEKTAEFDIWYSVSTFITFLALPMLLVGIALVAMFVKVRRVLTKTPLCQPRSRRMFSRQLRVFYASAMMYACFGALVMPYFSLRLILDLHFWKHRSDLELNPAILHVTSTLRNLTSVIDPLLYAGSCPQFQGIFKQLYFVIVGKGGRGRSQTQESAVQSHSTITRQNSCNEYNEYQLSLMRYSFEDTRAKREEEHA